MANPEVKARLERLLELLQEERRHTLALDMPSLQEATAEKDALVDGLRLQPEDAQGLEGLLRQIDEENRRNAFLLWTGLRWVRDLMSFFGKAEMPEIYGGAGQSRALTRGGRLLSGKV